jgi:hypothetical protein
MTASTMITMTTIVPKPINMEWLLLSLRRIADGVAGGYPGTAR